MVENIKHDNCRRGKGKIKFNTSPFRQETQSQGHFKSRRLHATCLFFCGSPVDCRVSATYLVAGSREAEAQLIYKL